MGRNRTLHHDLPERLGRDGRTSALRYKRPDTGAFVYLGSIEEGQAVALAQALNAAFGVQPPRGARHLYRAQFLSYRWTDPALAAIAAVKLPDIMPMQRGLAAQEEIRHSWAYQPPSAASLRAGLRPLRAGGKAWIRPLYQAARKNARARGIAFELEMDDIEAMVRRSGGRCEVTGVTLSTDRGTLPAGRRMRRPWAPSIDRMDSSKGYAPGNCRIVCCAANYAMSQWGEDVLLEMAKAMARKRIKRMDKVVAG